MDVALAAIITGIIVSVLETVVMYYIGNGKKNDSYMQEQSRKIQELEAELNKLKNGRKSSEMVSKENRDSKFYETQLRELEKEVENLKRLMGHQPGNDLARPVEFEELRILIQKLNSDFKAYQTQYQGTNQKVGDLDAVLGSLQRNVRELEKQISELEKLSVPGTSSQSQFSTEEIKKVLIEYARRIKKLETNEVGAVDDSLKQELKEFSVRIEEFKKRLTKLEHRFDPMDVAPIEPPGSKPVPVSIDPPPTPPVPSEKRLITPDRAYIRHLKEEAKSLEEAMGNDSHYKTLIKALEDIERNGDFEEPEEIMSKVYQTLENEVYRSIQRVAPVSIPVLVSYLKKAGFVEVNVHEGDLLKGHENKWSDVFHQTTSDPEKNGRIKQIHIQPYQLWYDNDGEEKKLILRGQCTCYKGV